MKKYKLIELYTNKEKPGTIEYAKVIYDDNTTETTKEIEQIKKAIRSFAEQEKISYSEFINNSGKIVEYDIKNINKKEKESEEEPKKEEETKEKKSLKKKIITITSIAAAFVMGFLIKGCSVNKDGSQKYAGSTATPSPTVSDNYNDRPEEIESFTVSEPTAAPVTPAPATPRPETPVYDEPVVENNSGVSIVVDEDDNAYGRLNTIVRKLYNGEYVSDEEFVYALNEINSLNYGDIPGLENLINGGRMSGRRTQVEFWKLFPSGSVDREVLRFFSEERNNVVNSAHDNNSQLRTRNEVNQLLDWCIAFIYNGEVVNINGNDYSFYDLSPIGRYILVDMAQEILTTNRMYVGNIDGVSCDFYTLINEFGEMYNVTTQNLENRSNIR